MKINDYRTEELVEKLNKGLALGKSGVVICKELGLARSSVLTRIKRDGYIHDKNTNQYLKEGEKEAEAPKEMIKEKAKKTTSKDIKEKTKKLEKKSVKSKANEVVVEDVKEEEKAPQQNMIEEAYEGEWKVEEAIAKLRKELASKKGSKDKKQIEKIKKEEKEEVSVKKNGKLEDEKIENNIIDEREEIEKYSLKEAKKSLVAKEEIDELRLMIQKMNERLEVVEKKKDVEKNISIKNTKETTTRSIRLYKEVNDKLNKYLKKNKEKKVIDIISLALLEYMEK